MKCCNTKLDFKLGGGIDEKIYLSKCMLCDTIYHKKLSQKHAYKSERKKGDNFFCTKCGSNIIVTQIAHPIHNGPFPLSGSGKCHREEIPYCPQCEKKPDFHGSIITTNESS